MSVSSSWRYSLSARTTPARKVPRAGDSPTCCMSRAMPITIISAAAVKDSRRRAPARNWNTGGRRTGRSDDGDDRAEHEQAGEPRRAAGLRGDVGDRARDGDASTGNTARIGITEMSCISRTGTRTGLRRS